MIHFYDRKTMAYTACKKLHFRVEMTDDVSEVTCKQCRAILSKQKGEEDVFPDYTKDANHYRFDG